MKTIAAAIQMANSDLVEENLKLAEHLIREAAKNGAQLVVLPEMFPVGSNFEIKLKIKEVYQKGSIQTFLSHLAKTLKIYLVGGSIPLEVAGSHKVYSASMIYDPHGNMIGRYDKIHLFDVSINNRTYKESEQLEAGGEVVVVPTEIGNLGLSICYDLRFPELYRAMLKHNVNIIIMPAAFTLETGLAHWEVLCRARAIENQCFLIAAGQAVGGPNRPVYGHSMIIDPWGQILAQSVKEESDVILAELDFDVLKNIREKMPVLTHRRF